MKPSAFVRDNGCLFGVAIGGNTTSDKLPSASMYWGATTPGWPAGDLTGWQTVTSVLGRQPDAFRFYLTESQFSSATGVNGSAGAYGAISSDQRAIANAGGILLASFKNDGNWKAITNGSKDGALTTFCQNLKRWHDDAGNTAPIKKIILCYWHEPYHDNSNEAAADFIAAFRYCVSFFAGQGIGPGQTYDIVEWAYIDIGTAYTGGSSSYYPGDTYCTWAFADPYNWGGGLLVDISNGGHIPTVGDFVDTVANKSRYTSAWKALAFACQPVLDFSDNHRTINIGLTEFGTSSDIDRYPVNSSGVLTSGRTHTALPGLMAEWLTNVPRFLQGLGPSSGLIADVETPTLHPNTFTADPRARRIKIATYWNSESKGPRWLNQKPVASGQTTWGTSLPVGITAHTNYDAARTMANDPYFLGTSFSPPVIASFVLTPSVVVADHADWTATITAGDSTAITYDVDHGDGSSHETGTVTISGGTGTITGGRDYAADGTYTNTLTILDGNSLSDTDAESVTVSGGVTSGPVVLPRTQLTQWRHGLVDDFVQLAVDRLNADQSWIETLATRWNQIVLRADSASWTSFPTNVTLYMALATASRFWNVDLTGYTKIKASVSINTALASSKLVPIYSVDSGTTWKCFDSAGAAGTTVSFSSNPGPLTGPVLSAAAVGPALGAVSSIPTEAQTAILLTFAGYGGDNAGTVQPNRLTVMVN